MYQLLFVTLFIKFEFEGELKYTLWLQNEERHQTEPSPADVTLH